MRCTAPPQPRWSPYAYVLTILAVIDAPVMEGHRIAQFDYLRRRADAAEYGACNSLTVRHGAPARPVVGGHAALGEASRVARDQEGRGPMEKLVFGN